MITPFNVLRHELIGLIARTEKNGEAITGEVVSETAKTIKIKTPNGVKTIIKNSATLEFELPDKTVVEIRGDLLIGRPEDRIKKKHRIKF